MDIIGKNLYYLSEKYYNVIKTNVEENKMVNFLNVQFSIFGEFSSIKATSENILKIMENLKDENFLPNTVVNQNIDINSKKIEVESRISFVTKDQQCNFVILDERIDLNYNFSNVTPQEPDTFLDQLKDNSIRILGMLIKLYNIKGTRLAININILGNNLIDNKVNYYYVKCIKGLDYYKDKNLLEWSFNTNSRVEADINNKIELLNVITNLSMATNRDIKEKRLLCHFDINTIGENIVHRFEAEEWISFIKETKPIIIELIDSFKEIEKNE